MTQNLKDILKFFGLLVLSVPFTWYYFEPFGQLYIKIFHPIGGWLGSEINTIVGFPAAYLFFVFLMIPLFIKRLSKWVYFVLLIPAILFTMILGDKDFFFPYIFALIGWGIALGIKKLFPKKFK